MLLGAGGGIVALYYEPMGFKSGGQAYYRRAFANEIWEAYCRFSLSRHHKVNSKPFNNIW